MIKIYIISVCKLKEKFFIETSNKYLKRLQPFCKIKIIEISEYRCFSIKNQTKIQKILAEDLLQLMAKIIFHSPIISYVVIRTNLQNFCNKRKKA